MGQRHIINGVNGSPIAIGYSPAVPAGLQFINYYGGAMPQGRNMAPDGVAARVVGSPVVGTMAEGVLCKSHTAYIQSVVPQSSKMTVLGVFCPTSDLRAYAISNANGARPIGFSVYSEPSGVAGVHNLRIQFGGVLSAGGGNGNASAAIANAITNNVPFAFAATLDYSTLTATKVTIKNLKKAVTQSATASFSAAGSGSAGLMIGSELENTVYGDTRVLEMAVWNRVLTDDEIAAQYAQTQRYYQSIHGISV
ncbi:TPA: hypothetical protein L9R18_000956 [Klebsiella pneumoniae]|nr:hypothetical protein [Klebsiella pneumoniae]